MQCKPIGSVYMEPSGGSFSKKEGERFWWSLWEDSARTPGHGVYYDFHKKPHEFAWVDYDGAIKLTESNTPAGFLYSFYHGMNRIETKLETGTTEVLISMSNWREVQVTKEKVSKYEADVVYGDTVTLISVEDIISHARELRALSLFTPRLRSLLFAVTGARMPGCSNGEIGIQEYMTRCVISELVEEANKIADERGFPE
jgi:hypothetical protein